MKIYFDKVIQNETININTFQSKKGLAIETSWFESFQVIIDDFFIGKVSIIQI